MKQGSSKWAWGGEWKVGWRVVFRGAALHQRKGNSLLGTLAGVLRGLVPPSKHLVPDKDQQLRMHLAN